MHQTTHTTDSPEQTRALAAALVHTLMPGAVVALHGELGMGKTCFVQGMAEGLGIAVPVSSPTYTLIQEYPGEPPLYHVDLYRIRGGEEALGLGLDEYLEADGLTVIEWAERAAELLPPDTLHVRFEPGDADTQRRISIGNGEVVSV